MSGRCRFFGRRIKRKSSAGIKKCLFEKREDLLLTGRTLFGAASPKGQELSDHYFGKIKDVVINFMSDLDVELWKLGIVSKTRHNEVAPNQFEIAPLFSIANLAADQNQLIMETIEKVALKHNLVALLHEKPFAGINGSGKHNNWSMGTDDGQNLLEPGNDPKQNTQFLLFLSAVLEAVDRYYPLLRVTTATATNDHRLGGHEAPPAIISAFLGSQLTEVLEDVALNRKSPAQAMSKLKLGVDVLPALDKDAGDRNRTSPFAFTGNKFEFRMPGSSSTPATTGAAINTIVAKVLSEYADKLEKAKGKDIEKVVKTIITESYKKHSRIIFNGNGYSEAWAKEAKKRGLANVLTTNESLRTFTSKEVIQISKELGTLTKDELEARYFAYAERYVTQLSIEARTLIEIATKDILPAAIKYTNIVGQNIETVSKYGKAFTKEQEELLKELVTNINTLRLETKSLIKKIDKVAKESDITKQSDLAASELLTGIAALRKPCDELEKIVDRTIWPLPTYKDLLFFL